MITITKERLLTIKQWRETYGPGSNVVLPAEEAEELARIALASLEAEPVAWTDEEELRDVRKYGFGEIFQCPPDKYADPRRVISLYRELPAPVVPDDWQLVPKKITLEMECALSKADSYEIGWLWALAAAPKYEVQNAKRVQNALNACRAAMLQSEPVSNSDELPLDYLQGHKDGLEWAAQLAEANHPQTGDWLYDDPIDLARAIRKGPDMPTVQGGNSPVTPDGWISCSERMPEMGERQCYVLAADFKNNYPPNIPNTQVGVYGDWFNDGNPTWDDGDGEDLYLKEVTHWMPLPEPPQEVNRG
ncbi:TPA: DUF551 domain-containing protein [Escherichia coli]|nr:DUF551 domain-containing protein [Escherichia coli]HDO7290130.1 DUF551 domain-containing protein [Escherichia coli]